MPGHGRREVLTAGVAIVLFGVKTAVWADDVTTLSGRTYRQVRLVRVEPDGVIWGHATGMCKVDFTDLPEAVREQYHYDAKGAAAYHAAQEQARRQADEQARQDRLRWEASRAGRTRQQQEELAARTEEGPNLFVFHREHTLQKADESVGEQIAVRKEALDKLTEYDGTLYDRRLWKIPQLLVGASDGHDFDPPDVSSPEYQRSLRRAPADKNYYQDVDRAEAFARGKP